MLTRTTRVKIAAFVLAGLAAIAFIGVRYVGLLHYFGVGVYTVHLELPTAGGIFPNAEVTYRGAPVGRVEGVHLTADGVEATLQLNTSPKIPNDVEAVVANRSVIGEEYVDLRPRTDSGPYLADGATIGRNDSAVPPSASSLLTSADALLRSVPIKSLQTTVDELDTAFTSSAENVRRLIETSNAFFTTANDNFEQTSLLINSSATALRTQQQASSDIRSFSHSLRLLAGQLATHDSTLRSLLQAAPPAARTAEELIKQVGVPLGVLLTNLTSTAQVALTNVNGVRELLVQVPHAVGIANNVVTPNGADVGLTLNFFNPLPCTSGYEGTVRRGGLDTSQGPGLNTSAGCTDAASPADVRGSQHVPSNTGVSAQWYQAYSNTGVTSVHSLRQLMGS